jgi:Tfp pilus assembly protein PilF
MASRTPRMALIEAMLAHEPNDPELRYFLAMEYLSAGDELTAADKLRELVADSDYVPAFLQAGQVLSRLGKVEEACAALRRGIEHARKQGNAHALGEMEGLLASLE